jgi:hypothetical protein
MRYLRGCKTWCLTLREIEVVFASDSKETEREGEEVNANNWRHL